MSGHFVVARVAGFNVFTCWAPGGLFDFMAGPGYKGLFHAPLEGHEGCLACNDVEVVAAGVRHLVNLCCPSRRS